MAAHTPHDPIRIAMWSGPRNISTALMRSWGSRPDTAVCDEPFYARYLLATGADHPGRDAILAAHETDERRIIASLTGDPPGGKRIYYQKHMAHHLLPDDDMSWTAGLVNCFLIREPAEMITSYIKVIPNPTPEDLGLPRLVEMFDAESARLGRPAPVVDARDILESPRGALSELCSRIGVSFDEAMLRWAPGPRDTDGAWAPHWYAGVYASTGFAPYTPKDESPPERLSSTLAKCRELYERLHTHRITA